MAYLASALDALPERKVDGDKDEQEAEYERELELAEVLESGGAVHLGEIACVELLRGVVEVSGAVEHETQRLVLVDIERGHDVALDKVGEQLGVVRERGHLLVGHRDARQRLDMLIDDQEVRLEPRLDLAQVSVIGGVEVVVEAGYGRLAARHQRRVGVLEEVADGVPRGRGDVQAAAARGALQVEHDDALVPLLVVHLVDVVVAEAALIRVVGGEREVKRRGHVALLVERKAALRVPLLVAVLPRQLGGERHEHVVDGPRDHRVVEDGQEQVDDDGRERQA